MVLRSKSLRATIQWILLTRPPLNCIQNSIVIVPANHRIFQNPKTFKKHGTIFRIGTSPVLYTRPNAHLVVCAAEEKPIKLIIKAMPGIQSYIQDKLGSSARVNGDVKH